MQVAHSQQKQESGITVYDGRCTTSEDFPQLLGIPQRCAVDNTERSDSSLTFLLIRVLQHDHEEVAIRSMTLGFQPPSPGVMLSALQHPGRLMFNRRVIDLFSWLTSALYFGLRQSSGGRTSRVCIVVARNARNH